MTNQSADVEGNSRAALNAFILRALRVEGHSLAADRAALVGLSRFAFTVQVNYAEGTAAWIQEFPPEEQVESAAARVRPLILNDDPTYYAKFLKAVGYFLHAAEAPEEVMNDLRGLKKEWAEIQPQGQGVRGYLVEQSIEGSQETHRATDNVLGFAWIYGDVVHNDLARLAQTSAFGVKERFRAAVPLVARIMVLTIASLNFARALHRAGLIPVDEDIFETPVIVTETTFRRDGQIYLGDPDTTDSEIVLPPLGQPLGEGWRPIHQVLVPPAIESATSEYERAGGSQLHVQVVDPGGTVLAEVDLERIESTRNAGEIHVVLEEANRVFRVEDRINLADQSVQRTLQLTGITDKPADVILAALRFISNCRTPNIARVNAGHTPTAEGEIDPAWVLDPPEDYRRELANLVDAIDALVKIQQHTSVPISVPDLSTTDTGQVDGWLFAARLLSGAEVDRTYPEGKCLLVGLADEIELEADETLEIELPFTVQIGGQQVDLGKVLIQISDATLLERRPHDGKVFHAFTTPDRRYRCRFKG
jgi:hypothetical protein